MPFNQILSNKCLKACRGAGSIPDPILPEASYGEEGYHEFEIHIKSAMMVFG